jgi:hypothetical protein
MSPWCAALRQRLAVALETEISESKEVTLSTNFDQTAVKS